MNQPRQPKGTPIGGEWAVGTKGEPSGSLAGSPNYGDVSHITRGSRTPWGQADHVNHPAPGIVVVGTPGHGGIKLSPERNAGIPAPLRNKSGWYEEDCEASIVGWHYPEAMNPKWLDGDRDAQREACEQDVRRYFTDEYEKATGLIVPVEESNSKQRAQQLADVAAFKAAHANEFVSYSNRHVDLVPKGYQTAVARKESTGEERVFLVPGNFYESDHNVTTPRLIDPNRHLDITDAVRTGTERLPFERHNNHSVHHVIPVDTTGMTATQRQRAEQELSQRYRLPDGSVKTFKEYYGERGVTGKKAAYFDGGKQATYYLTDNHDHVIAVSKATWDAVQLPNLMTTQEAARFDADRSAGTLERARQARNLARQSGKPAEIQKAEARYTAADVDHDRKFRTLGEITATETVAFRQRQENGKKAVLKAMEDAGYDVE